MRCDCGALVAVWVLDRIFLVPNRIQCSAPSEHSKTHPSDFSQRHYQLKPNPVSTIFVHSTIDIIDSGPPVEMALVVGFAALSAAKIFIKRKDGSQTTVADPAKEQTPYRLAAPGELLGGQVASVCAGRLGNPGGPGGGRFFAQCVFFQGGRKVGESDSVSGVYPPGQAIQDFNIFCFFN